MAEKKKNGFQEFSKHAKDVKADPAHAAAKPTARAAAAAKDATQKSADTVKDMTERTADTAKAATARGTETARNIADQGSEMARRGAEAANDAAQRSAQVGAETARRGIEAVGDTAQTAAETSWFAAQGVGRQAAQAGRSALDAASVLTGAAKDATADMQALAKLPSLALSGAQEMRQAWSEWMTRSVENATRASQEILRSSSLQQIAEVQSSFMKDQVSVLLDSNAEMLRIAARLSQSALRPIEERQQSR